MNLNFLSPDFLLKLLLMFRRTNKCAIEKNEYNNESVKLRKKSGFVKTKKEQKVFLSNVADFINLIQILSKV